MTITDHGECSGHLAMAKACQKAGIGFIPGIEGYWLYPEQVTWHREQKDRKLKSPRPSHICLLAANETGLRNLWALSSEAYTPKYHFYKPIATPDLMREYAEGIYASDGCMLTRFAEAVDRGDEDDARSLLGTLLSIYKDRFYMELHTWQYLDDSKPERMALNAQMRRLNHAKVRFAQELSVPLVVVNDSHHADPKDWINKELTWAFNTSGDDADKLFTSLEEMSQKADHLMGEDEIYHWMRRHGISDDVVAEAIKNSYDIANSCQVEIKPTMSMPRLADSERDDLVDLIAACKEGFQRFVTDEGLPEDRYMARLEEELTLIAEKHFAGYFNIVRDSAMAFRSGTWAHRVKGEGREPLLLGPGRGSAGGCLVAYLTGITLIDPLKYGTLFSRFLSPGRKGLPDIDIDLPQSQRPYALEYLRKRYGEDNVCAIGTLTRKGPKQALRDMGRALKIPLDEINAMSDHIDDVVRLKDPNNPEEEELTWSELIERKGTQLKPYQQRFPGLFAKLEEMVGVIRQAGVHPSGVLISGDPVTGGHVPLRHSKANGMTTQLDMHDVEWLGGVKFDWLGLRHLDTISHARQLIYERHGLWIDFDNTGLSVPDGCTNVLKFGDEHFEDPAIWDQISQGQTLGIFQVETSNCTSAAIEFKPKSHLDIADLTSIIRPGVSDAGLKEVYLRRRAGQERTVYDHPLMEKIVGPGWVTNTYGILVYQEQIMDCVGELAGFSPDERDDVRTAVGKKYMDKLVALKQKFLQGCTSNEAYMSAAGPEPSVIAEKIWANIEAAGRYAFNWSHAVEYGSFISTWEIWLKYYYPQEFLVALLQTDTKQTNMYLREARRRDITILPPDVNLSRTKFTIEGDAIRYGIDSVRGIGAVAAKAIARTRPYRNFDDYMARAGKGAEKTAAYNLAILGAFDSMGSRDEILNALERIRAIDDLAMSTLQNPDKLQATIDRRLTNNPDKYHLARPDFANPTVVYEIEKKLVGTYVTVDPLARYISTLDPIVLREPLDMLAFHKGQEFYVGGQITGVRTTVTKKGRTPGAEMAHMTISWNEYDFRVVIWPETWRNTKLLLTVGAPVACKVKRLDNGCALEYVERLDKFFERQGIA